MLRNRKVYALHILGKHGSDLFLVAHPIDVDEVKLFHALRVLEQAAQSETDDMRLIVESIVPTYHPKLNKQTQ